MSNFTNAWYVPPLEELEWLQGSPVDLSQDTCLLLLFQPNCPGCLNYALPVANDLSSHKIEGLDVYAVSTAFEDFEYNTPESTQLLLEKGELVGTAKQQLGPKAKANAIPVMPVAYDIVLNKADLSPPTQLQPFLQAAKDVARAQHSNYPDGVVEKILHQIDATTLLPDKIAKVFWSARAMGTPMWVLHKRSTGEILDRKLGQHSSDDLLQWITPILN